MNNRLLLACLSVIFSVFAVTPVALSDGHMSADFEVVVDGKSASAGKITFDLTEAAAEDGTTADPVTVEIMVPDKSKQKDIQKTIENNFRASLGDDRFKIKTHGSDRVSIHANKGTPWFALEMTNNTVQGVAITIKD